MERERERERERSAAREEARQAARQPGSRPGHRGRSGARAAEGAGEVATGSERRVRGARVLDNSYIMMYMIRHTYDMHVSHSIGEVTTIIFAI